METISPKKLHKRKADEVEIFSACLSVCTVKVRFADTWYWVADDSGKIMRFNGPEHANNQLQTLSTDSAHLLHHSAHAEMVGQPEGEVIPPLRVRFHWRSQA
ncbi:MAG: DUF6482 family protein [Alcanivorax jadensis]|uniref:DUF6482 family protein n=1 Tax=Alcanivorax jadensis TaxID=64988 RepID=UPI003001B29A